MGLPAIQLDWMMEECCTCGVPFWVTVQFRRERRADKRWFYCPNGHGQAYTESEADRLRNQLARTAAELQAAASAKAFAEARLQSEQVRYRKELARVRKRADAGVCQHCHRTFQNVAKHVKTKHGVQAVT